jgi:hypothetical protein
MEQDEEAPTAYEVALAWWLAGRGAVPATGLPEAVLDLPDGRTAFVEQVAADAWGGGRWDDDFTVFGGLADVVAGVSARDPDDAWVREAVAAVEQVTPADRTTGGAVTLRRAASPLLHVTAAVNRASIERHGLDWRRMGAAPGIAGSRRPEAAGIFLGDHPADVDFFTSMARTVTDVWSVDVSGWWLRSGPEGWWLVRRPVPPERLTLVLRDLDAGEPPPRAG